MSRFIHSKWKKTLAIQGNAKIKPHIPDTRRLTRESLQDMLSRYGMVYVKPDKGSFGNGVIRLESGKDGKFRYQVGTVVKHFSDYDSLFGSLLKETKGRSYLSQKGIHLLKHQGRRFDIRVMVQMNPQRSWETTGMVGRVAHPRKIVTNYHNGGTLKPVPVLLSAHMEPEKRAVFVKRLQTLGVRVAKQLHAAYPGLREIGIDVAVDHELHPWILEVNTCPDPFIFRVLPDKGVFRKVIRNTRTWGRFRKKA